jgi:uncharacterized protein (DUF924 family)
VSAGDDLIEAVHGFWFGPPPYERRAIWFEKDSDFDAEIQTRFGEAWGPASSGTFDHFSDTARGRLALLVLLDQFSRNLHRGDARAFSNDDKALALAKVGVEKGHDMEVTLYERVFMYLPFEHSENLDDQNRMVELCVNLPEKNLEFAQKHLVIIEWFGRFPHRNEALGRVTTPEEAAFLLEPDSSF